VRFSAVKRPIKFVRQLEIADAAPPRQFCGLGSEITFYVGPNMKREACRHAIHPATVNPVGNVND
jgi:hypothetical protein